MTTTSLQVPDYLCGENQYQTKENILLLQAASDGDIVKLKEALESGANPNYICKDGEQLGTLHIAATSPKSTLECVSSLIKSGANPTVRSIATRREPIHLAVAVGNKDVVSKLVEAEPKSISSENAFGNTCLHCATRSGSSGVVELLLSKGADVNQKNHRGSTSLHIACFLASPTSSNDDDGDQYLKTATVLLNNDKIDVDAKDISGYTPLHIAAQRGCDDMVKLLIDKGASLTAKTDIDSKGRGNRTAAGMAKFGNHASTLKIIEDAMNNGELHLSVSKNELLKVSKE